MKTYYKIAYGGTACIAEHRDGTATLTFWNQFGQRDDCIKCKSRTSARRTLSRHTDGFYTKVESLR